MALGGGTFTAQNKVLPGTYINIISQPTAVSGLGERGIVALPIALKWGNAGEMFTVTAEDFQENSLSVLGYPIDAPEMLPFRELFKNASKVIVYNTAVGGTKAKSEGYFEATYPGSRGNDLKYVIEQNVDDDTKVDVTIYLGTTIVNKQTVAIGSSDYVNNEYVTFIGHGFELTAGTSLKGGTDGSEATVEPYQTALDKFESYNFNMLVADFSGFPDGGVDMLNALFVEYTKRMRETTFAKFQTIISADDVKADHEGIVNIPEKQKNALYWAAGALAGAAGNTSCTNKTYNGELTIDVDYTQAELEKFITDGKFVFHNVDGDVNVLTDINTFVTYTPTKGEDFSSNQIVRGMDTRALAITRLHNKKYIGKIASNDSGRVSLWDDLVSLAREQEANGTLENYDSSKLIVTAGKDKKSTVVTEELDFVCAMEKLYMTITLK